MEYKRDPMYYRTKVDKLRTRLSAIPLVTRIDPGTNCPTNRGVNTVFPSIHPKRLDRPLDSFISLPSRNNQTRVITNFHRPTSLTNVHKKFTRQKYLPLLPKRPTFIQLYMSSDLSLSLPLKQSLETFLHT